MKHTVAAIQLTSTDQIDENLMTIERLVNTAKAQGAKLVLLPENCVFMGKYQGATKDIAEPLGEGMIQDAFAKIAQAYKIWLIVGAFATIENNAIYQTLLVYDDMGNFIDHYHKRHLFNVTLPDKKESYRESDAFEYGDAVKVIVTPFGNIGLAICYDLRFPEHFRELLDLGAEIFVLPAAFTFETGKVHWEALLRARAIENQCFMIASGQVGRHVSGRRTWGHSLIINPWGDILSELTESEGVIIAEIDLAELQHQRKVFPALEHRR